jgi:hypothetical protein
VLEAGNDLLVLGENVPWSLKELEEVQFKVIIELYLPQFYSLQGSLE